MPREHPKPRRFECGPWDALVALDGDVDVESRPWLAVPQLHRDAADQRVFEPTRLEDSKELTKGHILAGDHGVSLQIVKTHVERGADPERLLHGVRRDRSSSAHRENLTRYPARFRRRTASKPPRSPAARPNATSIRHVDAGRKRTAKTPRSAFFVAAIHARIARVTIHRTASATRAPSNPCTRPPRRNGPRMRTSGAPTSRRISISSRWSRIVSRTTFAIVNAAPSVRRTARTSPVSRARATAPRRRRIHSTSNCTSSVAGCAASSLRKGGSASDATTAGSSSISIDAGNGFPESDRAAGPRDFHHVEKRARASSGETRRSFVTRRVAWTRRSRSARSASVAEDLRKTVTVDSSRTVSTTLLRFSATRKNAPTSPIEIAMRATERLVMRLARKSPSNASETSAASAAGRFTAPPRPASWRPGAEVRPRRDLPRRARGRASRSGAPRPG